MSFSLNFAEVVSHNRARVLDRDRPTHIVSQLHMNHINAVAVNSVKANEIKSFFHNRICVCMCKKSHKI